MNDDSVTRFLKTAEATGIIPADSIRTVRDDLTQAQLDTEREVASQLVQRRLLTSYQAQQLLSGLGDELVLCNRYQIHEPLGAGGMGTVYLAQDTQLDRLVAVKVLPEGRISDPEAVTRFGREVKALAKLEHPAIVRAYDAGKDRGHHFLVMEYVRGTSLRDLLEKEGPISATLAADFTYQTALGLQHAHDCGLVHRDLKPSNLLVTEKRQIRILDLGLARFVQDQIGEPALTLAGTVLGTPDYMSPEQHADAKNADAQTDVYALGCTLYHMLTGQVPFPCSSFSEKQLAHKELQPQPIEELSPEVPAGLALVVRRMMAKRPADRFRSAREVAEALAPYVAGSTGSLPELKTTASRHGGRWPTSQKRTRLRLAAWVTAGVTLVAAVALVSIGLPGLLNKERPSLPGAAEPPPDPNVLTVAQDGSGQYRAISQALEDAKPGTTIRVLDDATYSERLSIKRPNRYTGLVIEALARATIENNVVQGATIEIFGVPGVVVRGFRLRSTAERGVHVHIKGPCAGLVLDGLEFDAEPGTGSNGIEMSEVGLSGNDSPIIVQDCVFRKLGVGVGIAGTLDYRNPSPCGCIAIRGNTMVDVDLGIKALGCLKDIQIVGNCISGAGISAIQLENLMPGTNAILIANNTLFENQAAFRLWDAKVVETDVQLQNNLVLGSQGPDMVFIDSGGDRLQPRGPGDGRSVHEAWRLSHNWREVETPTGTDLFSQSWIPPGDKDVVSKQIEVLSRLPGDPDFLRPASDSPLATAGAGKGDPSLPVYVGARRPRGLERWDWQETWDARHPKAPPPAPKDPKDR